MDKNHIFGTWVLDKDFRITSVDTFYLQNSQIARKSLIGKTIQKVLVRNSWTNIQHHVKIQSYESPFLTFLPLSVNEEPLPLFTFLNEFTNQELFYTLRFQRINTNKNKSFLEHQENYYEQIINTVNAEISVFNLDLKYEYINSGEIFSPQVRESLIGKDDYEYCKLLNIRSSIAEKRTHYLQIVLKNKEPFVFEEEVIFQYSSEKKYYIRKISPILNSLGEIVKLVRYGTEITNRKKAEQEIEFIANHDPLTNLPNRRQLYKRLAPTESLEQHAEHALILLDLDRFKTINDSLGHSTGDTLIQSVAKRLNQIFYTSMQSSVYRFGGDEFIITMKNLNNQQQAIEYCEKILATFRTPFVLEDKELFIHTSLGVYFFHKEELVDINQIIMKADTAMYAAKDAGRNTYKIFLPGMSNKNEAILQLEADIYQGYKKNEFLLFYQPRYDTKTQEIIGAEALLRWKTKVGKVYLPSHFLQIAENSGILVKIGEQLFPTICAEVSKWIQEHNKPFQIAINVSISQFYDESLIPTLDQCIAIYGLEYKNIILEMKENVIMKHPKTSIQILSELQSRGVQVTIDDFGSGYSSLSQLKNYPINMINLGRAFTQNVMEDYQDAAIVTSIVSMAHKLKLSINAEGVEDSEQFNFLAYLKCQTVQGNLFSRPLPVEEFRKLLYQKRKLIE
ncbi:MAG: EAL domain-containing protein [Spirochaetota bacterium]